MLRPEVARYQMYCEAENKNLDIKPLGILVSTIETAYVARE